MKHGKHEPVRITEILSEDVEIRFHGPSFVLGAMAGLLITIGLILLAGFINAALAGVLSR